MNPILRHETHINSFLSGPSGNEKPTQPNRNNGSKYRQLFPNRASYGPLIPPIGSIARAQAENSMSCSDIPNQTERRTQASPEKQSNLPALLQQCDTAGREILKTTVIGESKPHEGKIEVPSISDSIQERSNDSVSQTNTRRSLSYKELGSLVSPSGSPYAYMLYQKEKIEFQMREKLKQTRGSPPRHTPQSDDCFSNSRGFQMTNQARKQRRREHNREITNDLCEIVTELFIAEAKLLNPSNYGVDPAVKREQVLRSVQRFVGSLPPRYALSADTPSEVLLHMRLIVAVRSDPTRAVVHITNLEGETHWTPVAELGTSKTLVTIACTDAIGLLEYVTKTLATEGSRVLDADVMLSSDNVALDRFVVEMHGRLRLDKLSHCIEKFLKQSLRQDDKVGLSNSLPIAGSTSVMSTSIGSDDSSRGLPGTVYYRPSPSMNDLIKPEEIREEMKAAVTLSEMLASTKGKGRLLSVALGDNDFQPLRRNLSSPPILQPPTTLKHTDPVPKNEENVTSPDTESSCENTTLEGVIQPNDSNTESDIGSIRRRRPLLKRRGTADFDALDQNDSIDNLKVNTSEFVSATERGEKVEDAVTRGHIRPLVNRSGTYNFDTVGGDEYDGVIATAAETYDFKRSRKDRTIPLIPFDELMLIETLGTGRASTIYLAAWKEKHHNQFTDVTSNHILALKVAMVNKATNDTSHVDEVRREADIAARLEHPNICDLRGVAFDNECFCLAYEFCEGGSLLSLLSDSARYYEYLPIALDIANGMAYLHSRDLIHRDIKPSNILLTRDYRAKIADFGMSVANTGQELTAETGTYRYMAPEVIRHESYSSNADVYSFGVCLWQLITREVPFATMTPIQAAYAVAEGHRPTIPDSTPRRLREIITACWDQDASRRPSFTYIAMALADYAKMAFSPANVGAQTLQIANDMLANVEGNSTVNVDSTAPVVLGAYMAYPDPSTGGSDIGLEI